MLLGAAGPVFGQAAPGTDVFLVEVRREAGRLTLGLPVNLTARPGYDNQPAFSADGETLYYTTIGTDGHADVCRIRLVDRTRRCWETTPESEYSAADAPMGGVSVVRVERDSTQRLWRLPDSGDPELLLPNLAPVGYYAWLDASRVVAFVLGSPPTLVLADLRSREYRVLASDVGRSIQRAPAGGVSYLQRDGAAWLVRRFDPGSGATLAVARGLDGSDFHAWLPDGTLLMAVRNRVFAWDRGAWQEVAGFAEPAHQQISRLATSPDGRWLAFVSQEPAP
ncbi:MAG TPA: hypothetical protein VF862_06835 [Gemmatimonadales bacterium]